MKYNPITKQLFTDDGAFLKMLHCPLQVEWHNLAIDNEQSKLCHHCTKPVYDTSHLSDAELLGKLTANPHTCLKVDYNQSNLTLTHQTYESQPESN